VERADELRLADANFAENFREAARAIGGELLETGGALYTAANDPYPFSNLAMRVAGPQVADFATIVETGRRFYAARCDQFVLRVQTEPGDDDLRAAVADAGLDYLFDEPVMVLRSPLPDAPLPPGVAIRAVTTTDELEVFAELHADAYETFGAPRSRSQPHAQPYWLTTPHARLFQARLDDEPIGGSKLLLSHGIAGVGTRPDARGRGIGEALTRAALTAAFDIGVPFVTLQASPLGRPIYERLGFDTITSYSFFLVPVAT
jgi:ribosomal protein S18 acetylase RimI-like enzyme